MKFRDTASPLAAGWALKRARELAEPVTALFSSGSDTLRGVPPRRLRARTGAPGAREFAHGGRLAAAALASVLKDAGGSVGEVRSVLDFGCGSGRVLPHVAALAPDARCTGCDVDAGAITWAARHLREREWSLSGAVPPLPFAAGQFDLVYSISVFSHLEEQLQDRWLAELRRVLAPGGVALLTVHGPYAFEQFRTGAVTTRWCPLSAFSRPPLGDEELVFEPYLRSVWNRAELPGVGASYGLAFHGHGYLRRHWPVWLDVVDVQERAVSDWQDVVVCRNAG
jgi:SAM-dependent methyltransferase